MSEDRVDPYALWLLRLTLAIALLALVGLNVGGLDPTDIPRRLGFPTGIPMLLVRLEFVIAIALILGVWPRAAAFAGAASLLGAIVSVDGLAVFSNSSFNWTTPAIWIGALFLLSLAGDGAFALLPTALFANRENRP
jgi:putative oxidoreductase